MYIKNGYVLYFILCFILCFNVMKIVTVNKELFLYKIYVLTYLMMAQVQAETCSTHVKAQFESH
jgi:hypothetical protein